jgi:hypothetical protein
MKHVKLSTGVPYNGPLLTAEAATTDAVLRAAEGLATRTTTVEAQVKTATDSITQLGDEIKKIQKAHEDAIDAGNKELQDKLKTELGDAFDKITPRLEEVERLAKARAIAADRSDAMKDINSGVLSPEDKATRFLEFTKAAGASDDMAKKGFGEVKANAAETAAFEAHFPSMLKALMHNDKAEWARFNSSLTQDPVARTLFNPVMISMSALEAKLASRDMSAMAGQPMNQAGFFSPGITAPEFQLPEMFAEMLKCFDDPTDVLGMIDKRYIRRRRYRQWTETPDNGYGSWECEAQCSPISGDPMVLPIPRDGQVYGVSTSICIHQDDLEDMDRDWAAYSIMRLAERMKRTLSFAVLFGPGKGMPQGLVNNVVQYNLATSTSPVPTGAFIDWVNVEMASTILLERAQNSPRTALYGNRAGFVQLATTRNAIGDLSNVIRFSGNDMWVGSYKYRFLSWLPQNANTHNTANPLQPQQINFLLGDMMDTYQMVIRKDVGVTRFDPVNGGTCVTFLARARVDGYVKCQNTMVAIVSP